MLLHESGVYLEPFSVRARTGDGSTYHHEDLDGVRSADGEEVDAVSLVASAYCIYFRPVCVSDVGHGCGE